MSTRSLILVCLFSVSLIGACTTTLEYTSIPTSSDLFLNPIPPGSSTTFTCVRGAQFGTSSTFVAMCQNASGATGLAQWGVTGCTLIPNFCQDAAQLNSYLQAPSSGAVLRESRAFTCRPGHQIYYTRAPASSPASISTYTLGETTVSTTCLSVERSVAGLFISEIFGRGLFAVDQGNGVAVPYCFPKPNLCPAATEEYANDMLRPDQQLQFATSTTITLTDAFGILLTVTTSTYLDAPAVATCQFGFLSAHSTNAVLCKIDPNGDGYWVYADAPTVTASCLRRSPYCETSISSNFFTNVDHISAATTVLVTDSVRVVCRNGYATYQNNRQSNDWEARCTPNTATAGQFLVNEEYQISPGPYQFPQDFQGPQPCSLIWGFCDTRTSEQSPQVPPWEYNSLEAGSLDGFGTLGDNREISCTEGAAWNKGSGTDSLAAFTCKEAPANFFLSPAEDRAKYGYWIPTALPFNSGQDRPTCVPIPNICDGTYPSNNARITTTSDGSGSAISGAFAQAQVSTNSYYYDCAPGYSVGGSTSSSIPRVYCHANVVNPATGISYYDTTAFSGDWTTSQFPIDLQETTTTTTVFGTSTYWTYETQDVTLTPPTCTRISQYCPNVDLTTIPGTITAAVREITSTGSRVCASGYYPTSLPPPPTFGAPVVTEQLECVPIPSDPTGQTGKWVQLNTGIELGSCSKSPSYCPPRGPWSVTNFWKPETPGLTELDSSFSPVCLDGYTTTGIKGDSRTLTVTCSVDTPAQGCWRSGTCNPQCQQVNNYCVAPNNVLNAQPSFVNNVVTWNCNSGFTADGVAATSGNIAASSTCLPLVENSVNQNGRWQNSFGTDWQGCQPASGFCTLSAGLDSPVSGRVNEVATITCSLGNKLECQGGTPLTSAQRTITGATCNAETTLVGTWRNPTDPNCRLTCVPITDFCPSLLIRTPAGLLSSPFQAASSNGNHLASTTAVFCPIGYAAAVGVPGGASSPAAVTRLTATGPITSALSVVTQTAICAPTGPVTDSTVSGDWQIGGAYPGCAVVTDFCDSTTFPPSLPQVSFRATVRGGGHNPAGSAVDPNAGTATYNEIVFSTCATGYAKDFFPPTTAGGYEANSLGTARVLDVGYQNTNGAYRCNADGDWEFETDTGLAPNENLCDPVLLCNLPAHPSLANPRCLALQSPCPFETDARFFCSNGYLTQPASNPGWYDLAPAARLTSGISAVFDLECSTTTPNPVVSTGSQTGRDTWVTTVGGGDWDLGTIPTSTSTYMYGQRWIDSTATTVDPTTRCIFQDNYCSILGPHQSRFLTNVETLTLNANARSHGSILNLLRCQTGYQIAYGNFAQQHPTPPIVEIASLTCRPNSELVSPPILAGEWSLIQSAQALPAQCVPIDGFCQYTNPTSSGTFSVQSQTIGSTGTYCCAPGYKLSTSAATSTSVTCTAPAGPAPSTWLQNGQWLSGGAAPACVPITNYCSVGAITTTSTPLRVDSITPTEILNSRTFSCSFGYQIANGVYSRSYACTATDLSCGGPVTGSFLFGTEAPSCTLVDDYCPSIRLPGTAANTVPLQLGQSNQVGCDLGYSVTGTSSSNPLSYTCGTGSSSTGAYTGTPQCVVSTDYCSAHSVSLNVPSIQSLTAFGQQRLDVGFLSCQAAGYGIGGARGDVSVAVRCVTNPSTPAFGKWVIEATGADVSATTCSAVDNTCLLSPLGLGTLSANATGATDQYATLTCQTGATVGGVAGAATSALVRCNAASPTGWTLFGSSPLSLPTCAAVPQWCPTPSAYNAAHPGATLSATDPYYFGASGSVVCSNGYFSPDPTTAVSCLANRTWQAPSCNLINGYCAITSLGPLASPLPTNARLAETRTVYCAVGYQFISGASENISVTCSARTTTVGVFKDASGTDALCGPVASYCPSVVANGVVNLAVVGLSEVNSQGTMQCNLGSSINGGALTSAAVTCNPLNRVIGSWNQSSGAATACVVLDNFCGPVQLTPSTQLTLPVARYLDTYSLVCESGYYGLGTSVALNRLTCSASGLWTVGGSSWGGCVPIPNFCPSNVTAFKATLIQSPATGYVGSSAQFNCTAGTTSSGIKAASTLLDVDCGTSGAWVVGGVATVGCQTVIDYCSTSGSVSAGSFANPLDGALNQNNQFNCNLGYVVSLTNNATFLTLTCDISGTWRTGGVVFPGCVLNPNFCPNIVESDAVLNATNGNALGSAVVVTCNPGYSGDGARVCGTNGQWTSVITCIDRNECLQVGACNSTQVCSNSVGSYTCSDCTVEHQVARSNACVCEGPIWVDDGAGACQCSCSSPAVCGVLSGIPACVCPAGFVVNATSGECSPCGNLGEQCCASVDSCGTTGLVCQLGYCQNPPVPVPAPAPAVINVTQVPVPVPASVPVASPRTTAPPSTNGGSGSGGSSSADDASSLGVLFALAFQLI